MAVVKNLMVRSGADFSQLYNEMNKAQKKVSLFKTTIGKTLKGLGLAFSGVAVGKLVTDFTKTAMRTEVLDVAMKSVARASGYATQALQEHRKAVMDMGIAEQEASQILTRFMQAQLDTAYAAKVARVAQDAAVIANMNSSEAAEQMTEAIAKLRPELLSAFGFTRNLNDIYSDYAKTVGKTVKQLSETEKKQAMLNYILKEGEKIAGTYEASMGAVGKQIGSLPRYWQTLQNAIAKPLMLPGLGEAVEGITNALKGAISWAEANKDALQRWGQSIAGVVRTVVKGFSLITGVIVKNWQAIKFVGTTLLTYVIITKGVAAATTAWRLSTLALKGELMTKVPVLTAVSTAIGTYRLQMALAPAATNIFTAALLRLRVALYAVHTALGPIGWAFIGLSLLVAGGLHLWNKYTQSLQKTPKLSNKVKDSTEAVNKAINDQADALKAAGKAAAKNLQPFDEINQLQKEMATGTDYLDAIQDALEGVGTGISMPAVDFDEFLESLEEVKPTFRGFLEYLREEARKFLKNKWSPLVIGLLVSPFAGALHYINLNWDDIKLAFERGVERVRNVLQGKWGPLFTGLLISPFTGIIHLIIQNWDSIKTGFNSGIEGVRQLLNSRWGPLLTGIFISPFAGIIHAISQNLESIKKLFNFNLSLPKIKVPRFTVRWDTSGLWASIGKFLGLPGKPVINVQWLAKGGILTRPTLFGGGEAGREAVLPLDNNTGWADIVADRLAAALQKTQLAGAGAGGGDIYVYIGNEQVDAYIYRSQERRNVRSNGR